MQLPRFSGALTLLRHACMLPWADATAVALSDGCSADDAAADDGKGDGNESCCVDPIFDSFIGASIDEAAVFFTSHHALVCAFIAAWMHLPCNGSQVTRPNCCHLPTAAGPTAPCLLQLMLPALPWKQCYCLMRTGMKLTRNPISP